MSPRRSTNLQLIPMVAVLFSILLAGCGEPEPAAPPEPRGTIVIAASFDGIDGGAGAPVPADPPAWVLSGPDGDVAGEGSRVLTDRNPGEYTLTWSGEFPGWVKPFPRTLSLEADHSITFDDPYVESKILIEQIPRLLQGAAWELGSSDVNELGSGDRVLDNLPLGDYLLEWLPVSGWLTPASQVQTLATGSTISFSGVYEREVADSGTIVIVQVPAYLGPAAQWSLVGPAGEDEQEEVGSGSRVLINMKAGLYQLTWPDVYGWESPVDTTASDPMEQWVQILFPPAPDGDEATIEFVGVYKDLSFAEGSYSEELLDSVCWYVGNSSGRQPVGTKGSNMWGLYDMHGNVWEWVWPPATIWEPKMQGETRMIRGGSWKSIPTKCRSAYRHSGFPDIELDTVGFRPVRNAVPDDSPPQGFVHVPAGPFMMGSPEPAFRDNRLIATGELGRFPNETPRLVTLTQEFYMSKYEVTEGWWHQVMGGTPTTSQLPKAHVSFDMAIQFCNALSDLEGLTRAYQVHGPGGNVTWNRDANGYRLPTEAEWEYACRAGMQTAFSWPIPSANR